MLRNGVITGPDGARWEMREHQDHRGLGCVFRRGDLEANDVTCRSKCGHMFQVLVRTWESTCTLYDFDMAQAHADEDRKLVLSYKFDTVEEAMLEARRQEAKFLKEYSNGEDNQTENVRD